MNKKRQHIIFDLDGTIIDSKEEILRTYQLVFDIHKPETPKHLQELNFGATLHDVLKHVYGAEKDKIEKARYLFSSIYDSSNYSETNLYDGVIKTLNFLKNENYKLYVATNKRYTPTIRILQKKNILPYFSDVLANEMKPNIMMQKQEMLAELMDKHSFSQGFMVGDTLSDMEAGNKQKLKTIAVTYGYGNRDIFTAKNSKYIIDSIEEIIEIVKI